MNKDITEFIKAELRPRFFNYIPQIFPTMQFRKVGDKWCSHLHWDGTPATRPTPDKTVVTKKLSYYLYDQSKLNGEGIPLIDAYMYHNGISEVWQAVNQLCDICGVIKPEWDESANERYKELRKKRKAYTESAERQHKALYSPEGAQALAYLRGRGWSDDEIKRSNLGYISADEAESIGIQNYRNTHTLSIPLQSGGEVYAFKMRSLEENASGKYRFNKGADKDSNLYNLTGAKEDNGEVIVVEGELDTERARVNGFENVVATSGGGLTDKHFAVMKQRGITRVTLLFDNDEKGREFTDKSISRGWKYNITVAVAELDGAKDLDEYFCKGGTAEELRGIIARAEAGGVYKLAQITKKYEGEDILDKKEREFTAETIKLINEIPHAIEQERVASRYESFLLNNSTNREYIRKEALLARARDLKSFDNAEERNKKANSAYETMGKLLQQGKVTEALSAMGEALKECQTIGTKEKYAELCVTDTMADFARRRNNRPQALATEYKLGKYREEETFTLPTGAITFIVAPTSHGKSTMLQNLALQIARQPEEGAVLYFTFEEEADSVKLQLLNKYIGEELARGGNNLNAIDHYYSNGFDKRYIQEAKHDLFLERESAFWTDIIESGKLQVFYRDLYAKELVEAIRYLNTERKVKAVFIDYIQLLYTAGNNKQRYEELKDICNSLKALAIELNVPLVIGAQARREVKSPTDIASQQISDASDIEKIANKILFLWNGAFKSMKDDATLAEWQKDRFELGDRGKIYAKLVKNRGGNVNIDAVLNFDGNTGLITQGQKPIPKFEWERQ